MKKIYAIIALCAMCVSLFLSCSNNEDDGSLDTNVNVVTCNGKVCSNLVSAFAGGSVCDPETGEYTRLNIFDKSYSSYPLKETAEVSIEGLFRPNKTYKGNGDHLERIHLGFVDKYDVNISLNQGIFEGKDSFNEPNTNVSYVTIHSFSLGEIDAQGNRTGNADIHITIKMKDSSVIEIRYSGNVMSDEMY